MQITHTLVAVAAALMAAPDDKHWGYDLSRQTGVRSGALYPILGRLLDRGWIEDGWEDATAIQGKRPPRRYYTLTPEGVQELGAVAKRATSDARFQFRPQVAGA
jgi:PadR family transcriptional regulator PadR